MKLLKVQLLICTVFLATVNYAQLNESKRADYWHFGNMAAIHFSCYPASFTGSQMNTLEGSSTISDLNGNLLFYTDGISVWDKNNNIMPNGTGLLGHWSTAQSAIIIPHPGDTSHYFIFTAGTAFEDYGLIGVRFSEVDMNLNGGFGDVLTSNKNTLLFIPNEEKLTAVVNATNDGYWVAAQKRATNQWYAYEVTTAGVNMTPVISTTGGNGSASTSKAKFSPDGTMLATLNLNGINLYSFNNSTGQLQYLWRGFLGNVFSFSPDCSKLYTASNGLYQYDLSAGSSINDSIAILASQTMLSSISPIRSLQLTNKNSVFVSYGSTTIGKISNPNAIGLASNYIPNSIPLISGNANFNFPNFVQSFFNISYLTFSITGTDASCINNGNASVNINYGTPPYSFLWSTGDTTSSISNVGGGMYYVTVSDGSGGCSITDSIYINQPQTTIIDSALITNLSTCISDDGAIDLFTSYSGGINRDTILQESFETDGHGIRYTANPYPGNTNISKFYKRGDDLSINFTVNPTNEEGTFYFGARHTGYSSIPANCDLKINSANINGYSNLEFCIYLAIGSNNMFTNTNSRVTLQYNIDGNGWNTLMNFKKPGGSPSYGLSEDANNDGIGEGKSLTTAFQDFCYSIPNTGNTIELKIIVNADFSTTQIAFDNIRLKGMPPYTDSYLWSTGDTTQDISALIDSIYWVQITGSSGCVTTDTFTVTSPCTPTPINASFIPSTLTICEGDSITFVDNSIGNNIFNWLWTFNGGTPASANTQGSHIIVFNTAGNYNITLQVNDSSGINDTTIVITVLPRAFESIDFTICNGDSVLVNGAYHYSSGIFNDTIFNGSSNGCDSIIIQHVKIDNCFPINPVLIIPNVFSPNGDGENDFFKPHSNNILNLSIIIYNRWGEIVYKSTQINSGWDGRTNSGTKCPEGTYFYTMYLNENLYKGSITLLR